MILKIIQNGNIQSCYQILQFDEKYEGLFHAYTANGLLIYLDYENREIGFEKTRSYRQQNPEIDTIFPYNSDRLFKIYGPKPMANAHGRTYGKNDWEKLKIITETGKVLFEFENQ